MSAAELIYVCMNDDCAFSWRPSAGPCNRCRLPLTPALALELDDDELKAATDIASALAKVSADFLRAVGPAVRTLGELVEIPPERLAQSVDRVLPKLGELADELHEVGHPKLADRATAIAADLKRAKDGLP